MKTLLLSPRNYLFWIAVFCASFLQAAIQKPLFRFPDIYGNTVVFVSGEDIWKAPLSGGQAIRLTSNDGEENFPRFSPDGKLIAFTGEYDGNEDVYVMDTNGGHIRRVTYHPGYDVVVGWHPQSGKIIFRSERHSYNRFSRLFMVNPDGSGLQELILPEAAQGSFSPDGSQIAYNKVSRESRTWKRYMGGTAEEVYVYNFKTGKERNISNFRGTDRLPMWIGDKIYFSSDRDRFLNLYAYLTKRDTIVQLTHYRNYDIRRPSGGKDKIVYELGGALYYLDLKTNQTHAIPIQIKSDYPELRPYLKDVKDNITGVNISPSGKRALIVARGEVFTIPKKHGPTRNLTQSPGAREKDAVWSPNGKWIAFLSDRNGEYQIFIQDPLAKNPAIRLTNFKNGYRHTLRWSPDSKRIAFTDQTHTLYFVNISSKKLTRVDKANFENVDISMDLKAIYDCNWSPDSRYLAYSKMDSTLVNKIYIYTLKDKIVKCISEGLFNDFQPLFSPDGEHLFFISNRRFSPAFGDFEWEMVYKKMAGIYAYTLRKNGPALFPLKDDEENETPANHKKKTSVNVHIDFAGLNNRIEALPLKRGNYRHLTINQKRLFYLNKDQGDFNRFEFRNHKPMDLYAFSFKDRKEEALIKKISTYQLSADGSTIIYKKGKQVALIKASGHSPKGDNLNLSDLKMWYKPLAEWKQIFNEAWRMERDCYYEPNMHGIDWPAMKEKYGRLLNRATCRQDVRYLIGELIGELNTSHTYVWGGDDKRKAVYVNVGLLGADYSIDKKNNRYRFSKIYRIPDWLHDHVSLPLSGPEKNVQAGDYLLQVNGKEVTADHNIYSYFQNLAGKQVSLLINSKPTLKGARQIFVKPTFSEYRLRYLDWVEHNRQVVDKASHGQIGYLHLPDTFTASARIFPKYFYSQTRKKGLIVDGRYNGGGLDPDIFLERLRKHPLSYWTRRYSHDYAAPWLGTNAHLVCLTNRQAGSGGDELPYQFRKTKMGPIIGTRTWGGLVGYSADYALIDGGGITMPDYRIYSTEGKWVVENEGITPDYVVNLNAAEMAHGYDAQLMKGVEILMKEIKQDPRPWPKHPPFPVDK